MKLFYTLAIALTLSSFAASSVASAVNDKVKWYECVQGALRYYNLKNLLDHDLDFREDSELRSKFLSRAVDICNANPSIMELEEIKAKLADLEARFSAESRSEESESQKADDSEDKHFHGARSHSHPLPTQGIQHRHGNGDIGRLKDGSRPQVDVHALQRKLKKTGYYSGPINGIVDQETREALKAFMAR